MESQYTAIDNQKPKLTGPVLLGLKRTSAQVLVCHSVYNVD